MVIVDDGDGSDSSSGITFEMSSRDADLYESQNDQRLDELHAKIRTLRSVCTIPGFHFNGYRKQQLCSSTGDYGHLRRCRTPKPDIG